MIIQLLSFSPSLKIDVTLAVFQLSGKLAVPKDVFNVKYKSKDGPDTHNRIVFVITKRASPYSWIVISIGKSMLVNIQTFQRKT